MTQRSPEPRSKPAPTPGMPFLKGLLLGLVLGVGLSAAVALYVSHMPSPFVSHSAQFSTAPDKPIAEMPDISRQGLMNPSPVGAGSTAGAAPQIPGPDHAGPPAVDGAAPPQAATAPSAPEATIPPKSAEPSAVTYFVQTGAFGRESEAENQRANLALMGVDAVVLSPEAGDKSLYRVRVGPIVSVDEVRTLVATLKNNGISTNIIKVSSVKPKDASSR